MWFWRKKATDRGVALDVNAGIINTGTINGGVIQVSGHTVSVEPLTLPRPQSKATIESLLKWKTRLTDVFGRGKELESLRSWAETGSKIGVRLIHGPAGVGKTRLAVELAESLQKAGWKASLIDPDKPTGFRCGQQGTLLLVDYSEERRPTIQNLMRGLARMEEPPQPLRVLLMSRQGMDQWRLEITAAHAEDLVDLPLSLSPLQEADPWDLFSAAWFRAQEVLRKPKNDIPITKNELGYALNLSNHYILWFRSSSIGSKFRLFAPTRNGRAGPLSVATGAGSTLMAC